MDMALNPLFSWIAFFVALAPAEALQTFTEQTEHDLPLRRQNPIYLHHTLGNVRVQGWVQDRVRVIIKKSVVAETEAAAKTEFQKLELVSLETPKDFEVRIGRNRGADIVTKLKQEKAENQVNVDLDIRAPYQSALTLVLGDRRNLDLTQWRGTLSLNGKDGEVHLSKLTLSKPIHVNCQNCSIDVTDSKFSGHLFSAGKSVSLNDVESTGSLTVDTGSGDARLENTRGRIEVHTSSGRLNSTGHSGTLSFQSREGGMFASGLRGNLEAQTQTGQLLVEADEIVSYAQLDNQKGDVQVSLPPKFEGNLDLFSLRGEVVVQFPTQMNPKLASESYGPSSPGRIDGYIGNKNHLNIHAYTKEGGVRLLRKVPR
jgi:hypothetical protein